ncbi:OsmC family protein [Actinacidiphila acidipaludis]|uniref:OsmC family protein n=1 Tax=Actinacidiphila acidipaludis TaxID=2873382 RepID=A0ABS7Q4D7_9ACTN|nr:OsmC family protein [Streptomyces acidipaludis]MBY8878015.1 OsmC family protein [Streptomyces acidipaludis]
MDERFTVVASAGSFLTEDGDDVRLPHRWTPGGVGVRTAFTGGHVLHLAVAACVLNDLYREAGAAGVELRGVRVRAEGGFDTSTWQSTGISYAVELDSDAPASDLTALLAAVDEAAEIPRALRQSTTVARAAG